MYLKDPLQGFTATSGYLLMQVAFCLQAIYYWIAYKSVLSHDILYFLKVVVISYLACFTTQIAILFT